MLILHKKVQNMSRCMQFVTVKIEYYIYGPARPNTMSEFKPKHFLLVCIDTNKLMC